MWNKSPKRDIYQPLVVDMFVLFLDVLISNSSGWCNSISESKFCGPAISSPRHSSSCSCLASKKLTRLMNCRSLSSEDNAPFWVCWLIWPNVPFFNPSLWRQFQESLSFSQTLFNFAAKKAQISVSDKCPVGPADPGTVAFLDSSDPQALHMKATFSVENGCYCPPTKITN